MIERLPKLLHAPARRALRQAWELDNADKAERLLRNLARRLDREATGVAVSILEGLDEMLTVNRFGLPLKLRRCSPAPTESRTCVCRNVKRWRNPAMALRCTAAAMMEAAKGFRRLKGYKQLPILRAALVAHANKHHVANKIEVKADGA